MKVEDIMTKEVISVVPDEKIITVAEMMHQKGLNGVPVVENGKVLGMITGADLVSRGPVPFHIPSLIQILNELKISKYAGNKIGDEIKVIYEADAKSVMSTEFISVGPKEPVTELIKLFQEKHVNPIPVVDKDKNILGIVSLADIIHLIGRFREAEIDFLSVG